MTCYKLLERRGRVLNPGFDGRWWQREPPEMEVPVEPALVEFEGPDVLECVVVYYVDHRGHY